MKILPPHISLFSHCPRKASYFKRTKYSTKIDNYWIPIAETAMRKAYSKILLTDFKTTWKTVIETVDKYVFQNINIDNNEMFDLARKTSEYCLNALSGWYNGIYLPENIYYYPGVPYSLMLGRHSIDLTIPFIGLSDPGILMILGTDKHTQKELANNYDLRLTALGAHKLLGINDIKIRHLSMSRRGRLDPTEVIITKTQHTRFEKIATDICNSLEAGIDYPSKTELCYSCQYNRRCML